MERDGYVVPADPPAVTSVKKKTQPARSWILVDATGQGTILDADKHAIMNRVQIHARDLRILDPLLSYPSTILGREGAIVLNLEHIKAIITSEEVLLRDPLDEDVIPVVEELQRRLPPANVIRQSQGDGKDHTGGQLDVEAGEEDESPFEFRALEVALEAICSFLAARTTELETAAYPALDELTSKNPACFGSITLEISSRNMDRVRKLKSAMTRLTARVRDELEQLLDDDDDDMADLYLSRKLAGASSPVSGSGGANWFPASPTIGSKISRASRVSLATVRGDENDVEELEMLLEAYFMQIDSTLNKLTTLREYIDDTEDYINIQLDNHRNQLIHVLYDFLFMNCVVGANSLTSKQACAQIACMFWSVIHAMSFHCLPQLELYLSSGTVCLTIYSLVAGIFGVNIPYTWTDNHGYMFKWVVIVTGAFCASLFLVLMTYARYKGLVGS